MIHRSVDIQYLSEIQISPIINSILIIFTYTMTMNTHALWISKKNKHLRFIENSQLVLLDLMHCSHTVFHRLTSYHFRDNNRWSHDEYDNFRGDFHGWFLWNNRRNEEFSYQIKPNVERTVEIYRRIFSRRSILVGNYLIGYVHYLLDEREIYEFDQCRIEV